MADKLSKTPEILSSLSKLIPGLDSSERDKLKTEVDLTKKKEEMNWGIEGISKGMKGIMDWWGSLFKSESAKESAGLMGGFVGILGIIGAKWGKIAEFLNFGKKEKNKNQEETVAETEESKEKKEVAIGFDHRLIESVPAEQGKHKRDAEGNIIKYGVTLCARSARLNFERFGCDVRGGNADTVAFTYLKRMAQGKADVMKRDLNEDGRNQSVIDQLNQTNYIIAEICIPPDGKYDKDGNKIEKAFGESDTMAKRYKKTKNGKLKRTFGHRALAFRSSVDGKWYVADSYKSWTDEYGVRHSPSTESIPLERYSAVGFAVGIDATPNPDLAGKQMYFAETAPAEGKKEAKVWKKT